MADVKPSSLIIIGVWIFVILLACFAGVFCLIRFGYKISEEDHVKMVAELEKRHTASGFDQSEIESSEPVVEEAK